MSRRPFGRLVLKGVKVETGAGSFSVSCLAHAGSLTLGFFDDAKFSWPPKLLDEIGLSDGCGVRMALMAWSKSKYFFATRFTVFHSDLANRRDVVLGRIPAFDGDGL